MSFKCSVFGHRYGDPDVEREREEQGSEVVISIRETETCKRCGETRVVSENKEVTTLETPSDIVGDDIVDDETDDEPAPASGPPAETPEPAVEGDDDAELIDDAEESTPGETAGTETEASEFDPPDLGPTETEETPDADEDDGVILEADDESDDDDDEREPGQWPDEAAADTADEDDADPTGDASAEDDDWAPSTGQDLRPVEDEQPEVRPTSNAVTVPEGEFYCPECEFTTDVESSSLRAGDFCPECHRGSLTHRTDDE